MQENETSDERRVAAVSKVRYKYEYEYLALQQNCGGLGTGDVTREGARAGSLIAPYLKLMVKSSPAFLRGARGPRIPAFYS